jgi:F0F1-type ATP synthase assembly protein I
MAERKSGSTAAPLNARAQAKAAREAKKAEKARKRASNDPADMGRMRQIKRAYQVTHEHDRALPYLLLAAFLLPLAVAVIIGLLTDQLLNLIFVGLGIAILLPMIVLVRRAKKATYKRYAGQAGSAEVALSMLPKKWVSSPVIAANKSQDVVHRTLGPGGLVLIGEGEPGRVKALLASEVRKHERVAYGVPITSVVMGNKTGQVPLDKLADHIRKLPKTLQPNQVTDLRQRLRALDAVRPTIPVPKGPMPTNPRQVKGARQAMRGR